MQRFFIHLLITPPFRRRYRPPVRNVTPKHRINQHIQAQTVSLVDENGDFSGEVPLSEALEKAQLAGVDLVEVSSKKTPPLVKIIDYGKWLYSLKKKEQKSKKQGKAKEQKGIRLTFRMGAADLQRQLEHSRAFLSEGCPLKIQLVMRGRERMHSDLAVEKAKKFLDSLQDLITVDQPPKLSGHQVTAMVRPAKVEKTS